MTVNSDDQFSLLQALPASNRAPVLAAWGMGVDSTAMLVEMVERGEPVDHVLTADVGDENPLTYAFRPVFTEWLAKRGVPVTVVQYRPKNFKHYPAYTSLGENCLTNGTLPSIAFGGSSCSQKWKIAPQDAWTKTWAPAQRAWAAGGKVVKLIGYDCSTADVRRYAHREGHDSALYDFRYPLREWGWVRADCERRIAAAGLPVPPKSSCFFCTAMKPHELRAMPKELLRRVVLMEARAAPRLKTSEGLWRNTVKGCRGATPKPGSMTVFIRAEGLLPAWEIDAIVQEAPQALVTWQKAQAEVPAAERPSLAVWLREFGRAHGLSFDPPGVAPLYAAVA